MSQEDLALAAGISPRHLSFIENGKTLPSRDVVLCLAHALEVEPHVLGSFLEAAGYVAPYPRLDRDSPETRSLLSQVTTVAESLGEPACAHDRYGTLLHVNAMLLRLLAHVAGRAPGAAPAEASRAPVGFARTGQNGHDLIAALRPHILNWEDMIGFYRDRLFREIVRGDGKDRDPELERIHARLCERAAGKSAEHDLVIVIRIKLGEAVLSFRQVTMTLGAPQDIAFRNFRLALFLPVDAATREHVRQITV